MMKEIRAEYSRDQRWWTETRLEDGATICSFEIMGSVRLANHQKTCFLTNTWGLFVKFILEAATLFLLVFLKLYESY